MVELTSNVDDDGRAVPNYFVLEQVAEFKRKNKL